MTSSVLRHYSGTEGVVGNPQKCTTNKVGDAGQHSSSLELDLGSKADSGTFRKLYC